MQKRRGVLILTEGRSGSNWLGSLTTSAGLGQSGEWLDRARLGRHPSFTDCETYFEAVLDKGTAETSGFCVKIFPRHLHKLQNYYASDFILYCRQKYEVQIIRLTRNDRMLQAISFSRGLQTDQWASPKVVKSEPKYDFEQICRCYFMINRSYDYWKSYIDIIGARSNHFIYEDLVGDPRPYVNFVADAFGEPHPAETTTDLKVQRDDLTEEWLARFREEAKEREFLHCTTPSRLPNRTLRNLKLFAQKKQMKPVPYAY